MKINLSALTIAASASLAHGTVHEVVIEGFQFQPGVLSISVGDSVHWTNNDFIEHSATSQTGPGTLIPSGLFDGTMFSAGEQFSFTFTSPGTVHYYCVPHGSSMQGVITVVPPGCGADINGDSHVTTADLAILLGAFGCLCPGSPADLNHDDFINTADLTVLLGQFGCGT